MAYENTGTISKNKKKEKPNHPDITGRMTITEPGEYWISGWQKTGQSGPFYSLSFKKKEDQQRADASVKLVSASEVAASMGLTQPIDDDEIPF